MQLISYTDSSYDFPDKKKIEVLNQFVYHSMVGKQSGFTLIELLVAISIIGMSSTIAFMSLNDARVKARDARRKIDMEQIVLASEQYYAQHVIYVIPGTGWRGSSAGWFNYQAGADYTESIATGPEEAGCFMDAPRDPKLTSDNQTPQYMK